MTLSRNEYCHSNATLRSLFTAGDQLYKTVRLSHEKATIGSLCTAVELQNILHCRQQYKMLFGLRVNFQICFIFPILAKFGIYRQTFIRVPNIKFYEASCSGSGADIGRTVMTYNDHFSLFMRTCLKID